MLPSMPVVAVLAATPETSAPLVATALIAPAAPVASATPIAPAAPIASATSPVARWSAIKIARPFAHRSLARRAIGISAFEFAPPSDRAENASRPRIRIEPHDASFRRHPLQPVMHLSIGPHEGTLGIIESSRMVAPDLRKDSIERLRVSIGMIIAPIVLKLRRRCTRRCEARSKHDQPKEHAGTHDISLARCK